MNRRTAALSPPVLRVVEQMRVDSNHELIARIVANRDAAALQKLAAFSNTTVVETRDALELIERSLRESAAGLAVVSASRASIGRTGGGNMAALAVADPRADVLTLSPEGTKTLVQNLDPEAICMGRGEDFVQARPGYRPLPRWALMAALEARQAHLARLLVGHPNLSPDSPDALTKAEKLLNRARHASPTLAEELRRYGNAATGALAAYLEESTGRITLVERFAPLAPSIAARIDVERNLATLSRMVHQCAPDAAHDRALARLAAKLPTEVTTIVAGAGLRRIAILRSSYRFSREASRVAGTANAVTAALMGAGVAFAVQALGAGAIASVSSWLAIQTGVMAALPSATRGNPFVDLVARFRERQSGVGGRVNVGAATLEVGPLQRPNTDETEGLLAHEFFHVIDYCLGMASNEPEFQALYQATLAARARGDLLPNLPSRYAATDAQEFFAEGACAFLNIARPFAHGLRSSRVELLEQNPDLYAYFERLFRDRLPSVLASGAGALKQF